MWDFILFFCAFPKFYAPFGIFVARFWNLRNVRSPSFCVCCVFFRGGQQCSGIVWFAAVNTFQCVKLPCICPRSVHQAHGAAGDLHFPRIWRSLVCVAANSRAKR